MAGGTPHRASSHAMRKRNTRMRVFTLLFRSTPPCPPLTRACFPHYPPSQPTGAYPAVVPQLDMHELDGRVRWPHKEMTSAFRSQSTQRTSAHTSREQDQTISNIHGSLMTPHAATYTPDLGCQRKHVRDGGASMRGRQPSRFLVASSSASAFGQAWHGTAHGMTDSLVGVRDHPCKRQPTHPSAVL